MNHTLREELRPALEILAAEADNHGFVDKISTENDGVNEDEIMLVMDACAHPALAMDPMI
jgi:hypothetical protein